MLLTDLTAYFPLMRTSSAVMFTSLPDRFKLYCPDMLKSLSVVLSIVLP